MINAEKHKDELRTLNNIKELRDWAIKKDNGSFGRCSYIGCRNCIFNIYEDCNYARMKWMLSEAKGSLKVSKLEYDILLYIYNNTKFRYIARDEGGYLFAYYYPVVKGFENWEGGENYETLDIFVTLFKFVKWEDEEPTSIKEVLDNCIVENIKEEQ